jgi:UDP-N-acetylmuramate--alanine ligase
MAGFRGIKRRFEYVARGRRRWLIDDYAHHPREIEALIRGIRLMHPQSRVLGIFQPHLFSRTRDFAAEFASSLSALDQCILLPIYPARELPIAGVSSDLIASNMTCPVTCIGHDELQDGTWLETVWASEADIMVTIGAGDLDQYLPLLSERVMAESNVKESDER